MKYLLTITTFYLLIFSNCQAQKQQSPRGWSAPVQVRDYPKETLAISVVSSESPGDSIIFRASIRPKNVGKSLDRRFYTTIMNTFMSATKQTHYDSIYFSGQAPVIDPKYKEGRFEDDYLKLEVLLDIQYDNKSYYLLKVKEFKNKLSNKNNIKTFVMLGLEKGNHYLVTSYPERVRQIEKLVQQFDTNVIKMLFGLLSREERDNLLPVIKELKTFTCNGDLRTLDFEFFLAQIEQWKTEKQTEKLKSLYEK